jgi:hypothetical protein
MAGRGCLVCLAAGMDIRAFLFVVARHFHQQGHVPELALAVMEMQRQAYSAGTIQKNQDRYKGFSKHGAKVRVFQG